MIDWTNKLYSNITPGKFKSNVGEFNGYSAFIELSEQEITDLYATNILNIKVAIDDKLYKLWDFQHLSGTSCKAILR